MAEKLHFRDLEILYIDSYDSFAYNLTALLKDALKDATENTEFTYRVTHIQNDYLLRHENRPSMRSVLESYDMILIGPGPGSPTSEDDTGIIYDLLTEVSKDKELYKKVPIFGVCLGFQAICHHLDVEESTNEINYLEKPVHGQVASLKLMTVDHPIFANVIMDNMDLLGTRYHSIYYNYSDGEKGACISDNKYKVEPIATTSDGILMAAYISNTSIVGVQYHLESCCSNHGLGVLKNYITKYVLPFFLEKQERNELRKFENYFIGEEDSFSLLSSPFDNTHHGPSKQMFKTFMHEHKTSENESIDLHLNLVSLFKNMYGGCLMLGSLVKQKNRGEFSIFGIPNKDSFYYYYDLNECKIYKDNWVESDTAVVLETDCNRDGYYAFIEKQFQTWQKNVVIDAKDEPVFNGLPFTGGFLGILNYEMGDCVPQLENYSHSIGSVFAHVNQALVWDHFEEKFYFVEVSGEENLYWSEEAVEKALNVIKKATQDKSLSAEALKTEFPVLKMEKPDYETYSKQYNKCIEYLHKGESYELCLTTQCQVELANPIDPFNLFCKLSNMNPAPFSSFLSFPKIKLNLLSSSPERFIKWDSDLNDVELRPIKGTVSKKKDPSMTFEKATKILKTPKEFGENLMIVDLIRNDLYKLLQTVELKELMSVEEYETVYQLVSVIKGSLPKAQYPGLTGLDVLKSSLPPGSMTGAPKIKSVELLQKEIESINVNERGIYSGVTGFYSLNRKGDWSVNIRCLFSNDNNCWRLGAGGAITVLSDLLGEYDEMKIKLESALQIFQ